MILDLTIYYITDAVILFNVLLKPVSSVNAKASIEKSIENVRDFKIRPN